jgi:hypothetical protein
MKTTCYRILVLTAGALTSCAAFAQGTFQNLNFESPSVPLVPAGSPPTVPFTSAFPGWVGYVGTNEATRARIYGINLDNATVALITNDVYSAATAPLIEGNYTAVLQAGRDPNDIPSGSLVPVALSQSGIVPDGSMSLLFLGYTAGTPFSVSLGGVNIPIYDLETFPSYHLYGGDISAFAGSMAELRFIAYADNYPHSTVFALDSIHFSDQPIPEPSVHSLFALGTLLLGWRFRSKLRL